MYAVIFRATIGELDEDYFRMAERLKKLAFEKYGCKDFSSSTEGDQEIAVSYWETMQQIHEWKNNPEHRLAQAKSRERWYTSVKIDVCEVI